MKFTCFTWTQFWKPSSAMQLFGQPCFCSVIKLFLFWGFLMVFQITGEKRPSSEMMKPKPKPQKKKKKKDPNEPTKPVSAYALFFRDTQAAIKGQNPNATFGDVSKIVASMWDGLGEEQKQVCSVLNLLLTTPCVSVCEVNCKALSIKALCKFSHLTI